MVRYRRNYVPGGTYFFTVTLADRHSRALIEHVASLRIAFRTARRESPFAIEAIVILPDHLHAVMTLPDGDADFSKRWRRIKSVFTRRIAATGSMASNSHSRAHALWQRRFWEHTIRNNDDFVRHVDYIHFNPVRHGLVSRVRDWSYSSFHLHVRRGMLPVDWAGDVSDKITGFGERKI